MWSGSITAASTENWGWSHPLSSRRPISRLRRPCGRVPNNPSLHETRGGSLDGHPMVGSLRELQDKFRLVAMTFHGKEAFERVISINDEHGDGNSPGRGLHVTEEHPVQNVVGYANVL